MRLGGSHAAGFRPIAREDASTLQKCLLGADRDQDWLFRQCQRIAAALDKGEVALAQIYGLHIPIGELDERQLRRFAVAPFAKTGFNPDEPRIPKGDPRGGEWTDGADGGGVSASPDTLFAEFADDDGDSGAPSIPAPNMTSSGATTASATGRDGGAVSSDNSPMKFEMKPVGDTGSSTAPPASAAPERSNPDDQPVPAVVGLAGDGSQWLLGDLTPTTAEALKLLLARMTGATIVFGILFIPSNRSTAVEGPIAGSPDLSYRLDSDTGILQIRQNVGSLGPIVLSEAHIGTDGFYRDAEGQIIGRYLPGSGVVIDVGALPGFRMVPGSDATPGGGPQRQNQPQLCPDETGENIKGRSERSIDYQAQVSGLEPGFEVVLNGVRFDGCLEEDHTMLEAKAERYAYLLGYETPRENITADFLKQARAQLNAAGGLWSVEWYFAEQGAADFARELFKRQGLPIEVVYEPWRKSIH
jgi:hypothetical protein